jgi:hypothetical protein
LIGGPDAGPAKSAALRSAIEHLEPGMHDFVPANVVWDETGRSLGDYSYIATTRQIDCYDVD